MNKPPWLNKRIDLSVCHKLKKTLKSLNLHTVCQESLCPNISECFSKKVATFMILGKVCTRACSFCGVNQGLPLKFDYQEPARIKQAVRRLALKQVVITSPCRDDLPDLGAGAYCKTVKEILSLKPRPLVEVLIPDFLGRPELLSQIADSGAKIIAHNLETTPSLYIKVRKDASYRRSLEVLASLKRQNKNILTKSGLMLGLGENNQELLRVFKDLRGVDCDFLTLGQYLMPSLNHHHLKEYVKPAKFSYLREYALKLGFKGVRSSPYTRSSYLANP
jgi:lipoic acid synthetase